MRRELLPGELLKGDLARHLRESGWLTFTEIEIPGTYDEPNFYNGRVDVVAVKPCSYARKDLRAYEIKVSKSDFLSDVNTGKWKRYLNVFHRVYFAAPSGLIKKTEVPEEAGLIVRGDKGWSVVKTARAHNPPNLSVDSILALLSRGYEQDREIRNLRERMLYTGGVITDARSFGFKTREILARKKTELEPALQALKEVIEKEFGMPLNQRWDVERITEELSGMFDLLTRLRQDGEVMRVIADYLASLKDGYWSGEKRDEKKQRVIDTLT